MIEEFSRLCHFFVQLLDFLSPFSLYFIHFILLSEIAQKRKEKIKQ